MTTTSAANVTQQKFEKIMPEFPLVDVAAGVAYYRDQGNILTLGQPFE